MSAAHIPPDLQQVREALPEALRAGEFWPAFQPLVHLRSRRIAGFEILARWNSRRWGPLAPAAFIGPADELGLLHALSLRLIREACTVARDWEGEFHLAFNLAPSQFLLADLAEQIRTVVGQAGFPMQRVRVEITENALFHDNRVARLSIDAIKRAGATLSLDDFGTGHSSLTRLQALPFDEIKIDASFVRVLKKDPDSLKIVAAVLGLGQSLGVHVIAEGIETEEQAQTLMQLGCELGQGFWLGVPMPPQQARAQLQRDGCHHSPHRPLDASPFQRLHQLEALYQDAPVGLCFLDTEMRVVSANAKLVRFMDMAGVDYRGLSVYRVLRATETPQLLRALEQVRHGAVLEPTEYRHPRTGATFLVAHQRVCDELGGWLGISLVVIDITARIQAEQALQQSEEHFRRSIELGPHIAWAAGPDGVIDYMGPSFEWTPVNSVQERYQRWRARMHPEDRERVHAQWLAHLPSAQAFKTEFRILWPDNSWRWVRSQAAPQRDEQHRVLRWYGMIVDITGERRLQQRVDELEQQLAQGRPPTAPAQ